MIEFKGPLARNTEKFILKEHKKVGSLVWAITGLVFGIPISIFAITVNYIIAMFLIPIFVLFLYPVIPYAKHEKMAMLPENIYIDFEEETIVFKSAKIEDFHMLSDIDRIEDYGGFYYFRFNVGDRSWKYVCQKNLATEDELNEFRKRFKDLLVTK